MLSLQLRHRAQIDIATFSYISDRSTRYKQSIRSSDMSPSSVIIPYPIVCFCFFLCFSSILECYKRHITLLYMFLSFTEELPSHTLVFTSLRCGSNDIGRPAPWLHVGINIVSELRIGDLKKRGSEVSGLY